MRLSRRSFIFLIAASSLGAGVAFYFSRPRQIASELSVRSDGSIKGEINQYLPRDAIPPLNSPAYESSAEVNWLADSDIVIGFEWNNDARAYPLKIMNFHEIVNENIGGRGVAVTYCPLTRSALVFERNLEGGTHEFREHGRAFREQLSHVRQEHREPLVADSGNCC